MEENASNNETRSIGVQFLREAFALFVTVCRIPPNQVFATANDRSALAVLDITDKLDSESVAEVFGLTCENLNHEARIIRADA